jgi:carbohydrate kinase (thermoresistant glucokinase family)
VNAVVRIVVMGVAGSGKSTVGEVLADRIGARFLDADSVHPAANVAKMSAGEPLTDDDRWPWLRRLADELAGDDRIVVACSALKRRYRDVLREPEGVRFVFLDVDRDTAHDRARHRIGHFMGAGMVASQFDALEPPGDDEGDVTVVDATVDAGIGGAVDAVVDALSAAGVDPTCRE